MTTQRNWFALIAGACTIGTALELASERHWDSASQLVPWVCVAVLLIALIASVTPRRSTTLRAVRLVSALIGAASLYGVYAQVAENHTAGPLDYRYTDRWPTMSATAKLWAAISKTVGPSPPLAPMILALSAGCVVLSTVTRRRSAS